MKEADIAKLQALYFAVADYIGEREAFFAERNIISSARMENAYIALKKAFRDAFFN